MAKIFNTSGKLFTLDNNGKRKKVDFFEAPNSECDCGVFCCGDKKVLRWQSATGTTKEVDLEAIYTLIPAAGKREY